MAQYVGILDGSGDAWGVRIPDAPGCHGGGATPEAAIADAIGALREFAAHQQGRGIALSPPRRVQEVMRDGAAGYDPRAGEAIVMVPLILDRARPVKANISLDAGLLEAIDEEAERRGLTRSAMMTSAAVEKICERGDARVAAPGQQERLARQVANLMGDIHRATGDKRPNRKGLAAAHERLEKLIESLGEGMGGTGGRQSDREQPRLPKSKRLGQGTGRPRKTRAR